MQFTVYPSVVSDAQVTVPGDKSVSHRALMLGSIATGQTRITGFLAGEDCLATLAAMRAMGVNIEQISDTEFVVDGVGRNGLQAPQSDLDLGNSGTAIRLIAGLLSGQSFAATLTGDASLRSRPMGRIVKPLTMLGARIVDTDGKPPLTVQGTGDLKAIDYTLPVASAQVKSAILMAAMYAKGTTSVTEPAVTRDHTERMLRTMGADVQTRGNCISMAGGQALTGCDIEVPADLSSASFVMLAAVLSKNANVLIKNVGVNPTRTGIIDILQSMGADISLENPQLQGNEPVADIRARASRLQGGPVDPAMVSLAIDEFPVLFVAAAAASGTTVFSGLEELRVKESDRIATMANGLQRLGIEVEETDDGAIVKGGKFSGGRVDSFGDHRVAMSLAVAGTIAAAPVTVCNVAAVETSFPGFSECLQALGVDIRRNQAPVITIDGPSGSGKGTIARLVAERLGYALLDSGALYRLVALAARKAGVELDDEPKLAQLARNLDVEFATDEQGDEIILLQGSSVGGEIRTEEAGAGASAVAAIETVRAALLERQRAFRAMPGLVADGRDMGTHVFPDAALKIFLTASAEERAQRRHKQLKDKGMDVTLAALSRDIEDRDRRDSERSVAPLKPARDARILDSTGTSIEAVTQTVLDWVAQL
ncbi:MAG: 3-phosphoshikimate 1-carboxyvinyltransferase [Woeseiaceae bacterium]